MLDLLRRCDRILGRDQRARWILLILLACLVSVLEAMGALLVFGLLSLVTSPDTSVRLPLFGTIGPGTFGLSSREMILWSAGVCAAFFSVRAAVTLTQTYAQSRVSSNASARMAGQLLARYLGMPYAAHLQRDSASMIRNTFDSVDVVSRFVLSAGVNLASQALLVIGMVVVLSVAAPAATLTAALALVPLVLVLLKLVQPRLASLGRETQDLSHQSYQSVQQSLRGIRDVILMGRAEYFRDEFVERRMRTARANYVQSTLAGLPRIVLETLFIFFVLAYIGAAVLSADSPAKAFAVLGLFAYAVLRLLPALTQIVSSLNLIKFGSAALDNVYDDFVTLAIPRSRKDPDAACLPMSHEIHVSDVTFQYSQGNALALAGIDLTIKRGESIGLVGPTGGGKSTLVDVIIGLLSPTSGAVLVDGANIATQCAAWQRNIGVVSQNIFLLDGSLRSNIAFGLREDEIDEERVLESLRLSHLESFVKTLPQGMETRVGEHGVRLSGGQRQRVAIARALYRKPDVLVLDEGTSALDNETEENIVDALETLRGKQTIIQIAHRLSTVRNCDRILVLLDGRIVEEGKYDDLAASNGHFRRLLR